MKTPAMLQAGAMEIDRDALYRIAHRCVPGKCRRDRCCCASYEIVVDPDEIGRIIGYMPAASRYAPLLGSGSRLENVFEENPEDGTYTVDADEDGLCVFAYGDRRRGVLCSLHTAALDLGLPHSRTKPVSCVLWPLAITEDRPLVLSVAEDAFRFPCNRRRRDPGGRLDPGIERIVRDVFGPAILARVQAPEGRPPGRGRKKSPGGAPGLSP